LSHIVTIQSRIHDPAAVAAACQRLDLVAPVEGTAPLFMGEATGLLVRLPDWEYPVAINTLTGTMRCDNFKGHWGDQAHLDRFLQAYAVEKARLEGQRRGHRVTEQALENGSILLQVVEGP
jgi:hypothetical protein